MTKEKKQESIIVIAAGFMVLYYIFEVKHFMTVAFIVLLAGTFSEKLSGYIAIAWYKLSGWLGLINSRIILSIVFFVFLTPIAFLKKIFDGGKKKVTAESNYIAVGKTYAAKDLENTW